MSDTWADHRAKGFESRSHHKQGQAYNDGHNLKAKTCECAGETQMFDSNDGRCVKCGREPTDKRRYRL